jgi:8-oxo-dGTP diphosphatase
LRSTCLVDAAPATVAAVLRHPSLAEECLVDMGVRARIADPVRPLLGPGDEIDFRGSLAGVPLRVRTRVVRADSEVVSSVIVAGPARHLRHETTVADLGGRSLITDSLEWTTPFGALGRLVDVVLLRRLVLRVLARRRVAVRKLAESWTARPVVVGTAIVHKGRMLAQQRNYPASDAGRWELPGGRVEHGESECDAVVRECKEELDVDVRPTGRVGTDVPLPNGMVLRLHAAELMDPGSTPRAVEHHDVRWVEASDLAALDWLDADRVLVHSLRALLRD